MENRLDYDTRELLRKSHSASQSLVYIIDDLLNLTRSQDGSFPLLELGFDIRSALSESLKPLEHHAHRKAIQFIVCIDQDFPQFVRGSVPSSLASLIKLISPRRRFPTLSAGCCSYCVKCNTMYSHRFRQAGSQSRG
jgi:signal transduction histidine kinase